MDGPAGPTRVRARPETARVTKRSTTQELRQALVPRLPAAAAERALRELIAAKVDVEYSADLMSATKADRLIRRAKTLVEIAIDVVRLGR